VLEDVPYLSSYYVPSLSANSLSCLLDIFFRGGICGHARNNHEQKQSFVEKQKPSQAFLEDFCGGVRNDSLRSEQLV